LREAHEELALLREHAETLAQERQEAAAVVDKRRAERASAQAAVDQAKAKAIAAKVVARPGYLIEAEDKLNRITSELDFAESVLSKADEALRDTEAAINTTTTGVRTAARAMLAVRAGETATLLTKLEAEAASMRIEFRGLIAATQGMGLHIPQNAVDCWRMPPGYDGTEPVINSPGYRRERELAQAWRNFIDAAVKNPAAPMPEED
jgi:hypothetical protein